LQLVAGEDDQLAGIGLTEHGFHEPPPEGAGAAGDQYDLAVQVRGQVQGGRCKSAQGALLTAANPAASACLSQARVKRPLTITGIGQAMRRRDLLPLIALAAVAPAWALAAEDKKKKKSGGENYIPIDAITGTTHKAAGRR